MRYSWKALLIWACSILPLQAFEVTAFIPDYGTGFDLKIEDLDKISQINWFTAVPSARGELTVPGSFSPNNAKVWIDYAHTIGVRSFITLGGANNSQGFSSAVSPLYRSDFVDNIVDLVERLDLDGVDLDWEFPGWSDGTNFVAFINELKASLPPGKYISMDVPANDYYGRQIPAASLTAVDYVNIMSYDDYYPGDPDPNHSSYSKMLAHLNYWTNNRGVPKSKIIVGVPFYGRNGSSALSYSDLVGNYSVSSSSDQAGGYYFNGVNTMKQKTAYLRDNGYGGVMIWELSQDVTGPLSLLDAINSEVTPMVHEDVIPLSSSSEEVSSSADVSSSIEVSSSAEVSSSVDISSSSESVASLLDGLNLLNIEVQEFSSHGMLFSNPTQSMVQINVYNSFGQLLDRQSTQSSEVTWSQSLNRGVYYIQLSSPSLNRPLNSRMVLP